MLLSQRIAGAAAFHARTSGWHGPALVIGVRSRNSWRGVNARARAMATSRSRNQDVSRYRALQTKKGPFGGTALWAAAEEPQTAMPGAGKERHISEISAAMRSMSLSSP